MTDSTATRDHGERKKTAEEIEADMSRTRTALTDDIKALGDKLSPEHLKQGAKEVLRDAKEEATDMLRTAKDHAIDSVTETMNELGDRARRAGHVTGDFVSANAIPLALMSIGAGWLMLTMRHQRQQASYRGVRSEWRESGGDYRTYGSTETFGSSDKTPRTTQLIDKARDGMHHLQERTGETINAVRSKVTTAASDIGHRADELSHEALARLDAAQRETRNFARENPVAVGALAVAAGVAVGLLLPATEPENRLMGATRDRLLDDVKDTAQRVGRTAQDAAQDLRGALAESSLLR